MLPLHHLLESTVDQLAAQLGNIDLVYEALGASHVAFEVMKVLGANAVFIFTGVPGHNAPIPVDSSLLMSNLVSKNQIVVGTVNAGKDAFEAAIHDLSTFTQQWTRAVRTLITARYPLEDFHAPLFGETGGIKKVTSFSL
jgi:glucose 1-dehydrogenase